MIVTADVGETVTVILASGARLVGTLTWAGETTTEVDGWTLANDKIQGWKLGAHPCRRPGARTSHKTDVAGDA